MRNFASLPIISEKKMFKSYFLSTFSPEIAAENVEESLKDLIKHKEVGLHQT
jgi:hypothetical protein